MHQRASQPRRTACRRDARHRRNRRRSRAASSPAARAKPPAIAARRARISARSPATHCAEVAHPPERADLAKLAGADRDGVEELLDLRQPRRGGDDRAHAMPGQPVGLGERVEVDERVGPVGIGEQVVRRAGAAVEIAVGLVDDQREAVGAGQIAERRAASRPGIPRRRGCSG